MNGGSTQLLGINLKFMAELRELPFKGQILNCWELIHLLSESSAMVQRSQPSVNGFGKKLDNRRNYLQLNS